MSELNPNDRLVTNSAVVLHTEFNDWSVLFHPEFDSTLATGPVGVAIWKAFNGQRSLAEIATMIQAECDDAPATVLEDTLTFSQELFRRGYILMSPEGD